MSPQLGNNNFIDHTRTSNQCQCKHCLEIAQQQKESELRWANVEFNKREHFRSLSRKFLSPKAVLMDS